MTEVLAALHWINSVAIGLAAVAANALVVFGPAGIALAYLEWRKQKTQLYKHEYSGKPDYDDVDWPLFEAVLLLRNKRTAVRIFVVGQIVAIWAWVFAHAIVRAMQHPI